MILLNLSELYDYPFSMGILIKESQIYHGAATIFKVAAMATGVEAIKDFAKHDIIEGGFTAWGSLLLAFSGSSLHLAGRRTADEERTAQARTAAKAANTFILNR